MTEKKKDNASKKETEIKSGQAKSPEKSPKGSPKKSIEKSSEKSDKKSSAKKSEKKGSTPKAKTNTKEKSKTMPEDFAIIETGGKQYMVYPGLLLDVEKIESNTKDLIFDKVLFSKHAAKQSIGQPFIKGAKVSATLQEQVKDDKLIVFKFKTKTGYKKTQGHRQKMTRVKIESL